MDHQQVGRLARDVATGPVPEVDRLAVRVVTDSYQLAIAPTMKVGDVEVQRFGMPPAGKSLLGEFGLSMHLESRRGDETRSSWSFSLHEEGIHQAMSGDLE